METRNNQGSSTMYEYDFKGFKDSKNLFHEKSNGKDKDIF